MQRSHIPDTEFPSVTADISTEHWTCISVLLWGRLRIIRIPLNFYQTPFFCYGASGCVQRLCPSGPFLFGAVSRNPLGLDDLHNFRDHWSAILQGVPHFGSSDAFLSLGGRRPEVRHCSHRVIWGMPTMNDLALFVMKPWPPRWGWGCQVSLWWSDSFSSFPYLTPWEQITAARM